MPNSYYAIVEAREGFLLDGVTKHVSSRFEREEDARAWADASIEINNDRKGRRGKAFLCGVFPTELPPQILHRELEG